MLVHLDVESRFEHLLGEIREGIAAIGTALLVLVLATSLPLWLFSVLTSLTTSCSCPSQRRR